MKIILVVILSFEVARVIFTNIIIVTKKVNKKVFKNCYFTINRDVLYLSSK